jgi:hypothetical protein
MPYESETPSWRFTTIPVRCIHPGCDCWDMNCSDLDGWCDGYCPDHRDECEECEECEIIKGENDGRN